MNARGNAVVRNGWRKPTGSLSSRCEASTENAPGTMSPRHSKGLARAESGCYSVGSSSFRTRKAWRSETPSDGSDFGSGHLTVTVLQHLADALLAGDGPSRPRVGGPVAGLGVLAALGAPGAGALGRLASAGPFRRRLRSYCRTHFRARLGAASYFSWSSRLSRLLLLRHNPLVSSLLSVRKEIIVFPGGPVALTPGGLAQPGRGPGVDGWGRQG